MEKTVLSSLHTKAKSLGFDSSQALLRYVSKAIIDGRSVTFGEEKWGEPSDAMLQQWQNEVEELPSQLKSGEAKSFNNIDDLMADLRT